MLNFYKGKNVFITGHTGFKGAWLCSLLSYAGANITGYALPSPTDPSLFDISGIQNDINSIIGDIRNRDNLNRAFVQARPEIVFHLAAQPLVRESYSQPSYTYETNVMGTVNILECIRHSNSVRSFLNITTDKVYKNNEWEWGYRENDVLDGYDPYSNSKSCSELITQSYKRSFFSDGNVAVSTARAGNVIGGGDFAADRIIPDCIRAVTKNEHIVVRNPNSIRPYQHVLEPLFAYLAIANAGYESPAISACYNVGPDDCDCVTTGDLVDMFCKSWGDNATWDKIYNKDVHEANFLKLDCSKIKSTLGWSPHWNINTAINKTVELTKVWLKCDDVKSVMYSQIREYLEGI